MLLLVTLLYSLLAFSNAITCGSLTHINATSSFKFFTTGPINCDLTFTAPPGLSITCALYFGEQASNCSTDQLKILEDNDSTSVGPFCGTQIITAETVITKVTVNFKISSMSHILTCSVRQLSTSSTTSPISTETSTLETTMTRTTSSESTTMAASSPKTLPCNSVTNLDDTPVTFKTVGPSSCNFTFTAVAGFKNIYCSMFFIGKFPSSNCTTDQLNFYVGNNFAGGPYCGIWNLTVYTGSTSLTFHTEIGTTTNYLICSINPSLLTTAATSTTSTMTTEPSSCSCGINSSSRIIGGTEAMPNQNPWQVRLNLFSTNGTAYSLCGGTLISPNFVLTAAHCVERNIRAKIFLGDYSTEEDDTYEVVFNSTTLIQHSGWSSTTLANDIALIRLPSPVSFSPGIQPACLPFKFVNFSFAGSTCTASGWGRINDSNGDIATILHQTNVTVIENNACSDTWSNHLLPSMICVQQPGTGTCHGDSGGPLGYNVPTEIVNRDRTYVIGVVSFGDANGCTSSPNVFTRVTSFLSWIESTSGEAFCNI